VVNVGQENKEHHFEVVVYDASGPEPVTSASKRTGLVKTDEVINVELRQLFVTVEGGTGRQLSRDDFIVLDNGVPQQLVTFERGDVPFTACSGWTRPGSCCSPTTCCWRRRSPACPAS
jgi:hypothetical protein